MNAYLIIREETTQFEHVLAHISSDLAVGSRVRQGQVIGKIRPWGGNEHVHWGVFRGNMTASFVDGWGFGRIPINVTREQATAKGWVDPLAIPSNDSPRPDPRLRSPRPRPPAVPPVASIPAPPRLQGPGLANSTPKEAISGRVQFSWLPASGATGYELEARDAQTRQLLFGQSTPNTQVSANLPAGRSVEWFARACNPSGCSANSTPLYFNTQGAEPILTQRPAPTPTPAPPPTPAPRPALQVPASPNAVGPGSVNEPGPQQSGTRVTLEWTAVSGATEYDLGVRDIITNRLVFDQRVRGTSQRVTLEPGSRYRWNVAACNVAGCSRFTAPLHFTMSAETAGGGNAATLPDIPRGLSPGRSSEPGQRMSIDSVTLQWAEVRGATRYEIDLRDLTARRDIVVRPLTQRFHIFRMTKGNSYRWRVRACSPDGCGGWTSWLFITAPA
jgi:hypothetical protein